MSLEEKIAVVADGKDHSDVKIQDFGVPPHIAGRQPNKVVYHNDGTITISEVPPKLEPWITPVFIPIEHTPLTYKGIEFTGDPEVRRSPLDSFYYVQGWDIFQLGRMSPVMDKYMDRRLHSALCDPRLPHSLRVKYECLRASIAEWDHKKHLDTARAVALKAEEEWTRAGRSWGDESNTDYKIEVEIMWRTIKSTEDEIDFQAGKKTLWDRIKRAGRKVKETYEAICGDA